MKTAQNRGKKAATRKRASVRSDPRGRPRTDGEPSGSHPTPHRAERAAASARGREARQAAAGNPNAEDRRGNGRAKPVRSPKSDWRAIATFVVEFEEREGNGSALQRRTRIQHHEACVDQEWPGFAGDEVCHWMSARLARQLAASERATRAVAAAHRTLPGPAQPAPADLRIATVRLLRLEHPDRNVTLFERGRSAPGVVASRSSCAVEVMLEPAPGPRDAGGGSVAQIDGICLRAFNRDTGQSFELGRMQIGRHGPHPTACTLRMPLPAALAAGSYRVTCIPLTSGAALEPATVTLPLLQVV